MENRVCSTTRNTNETKISLSLNIEGNGIFEGRTGIGFFDHMLNLFTKHGEFSLMLEVKGDLEIDGHHTVEDVGIVLGEAFKIALGDKKGIARYGDIILPMDEALIMVALDLGGRPYLNFNAEMPVSLLGNFETELVEEFLRAFTMTCGLNLHVKLLEGKNTHHIIEGIFKGFARSLKKAVRNTGSNEIPSTKGSL